MVSIIFINFLEISQELSEPYQSVVTKVMTCKDAVGAFFIHLRHSSEISPPLRSDQFEVCCLLDFSFLLKNRRYGKAQTKTKG